jgi:hypothetical protein
MELLLSVRHPGSPTGRPDAVVVMGLCVAHAPIMPYTRKYPGYGVLLWNSIQLLVGAVTAVTQVPSTASIVMRTRR